MARPFGTLKYDNLEELQTGIDQYFTDCDDNNKPYTMYGLANALNIHRETLLNYSKNLDYFDAISRARSKCREYSESRLYDKDGVQGAKFALINNAKEDNWSDKQEISMDIQPITFVNDLQD